MITKRHLNLLVKVTMPDKSVHFIETRKGETYGDICNYVKTNLNTEKNCVIIPSSKVKVKNDSVLEDITDKEVFRIDVMNFYDYESQDYFREEQEKKSIENLSGLTVTKEPILTNKDDPIIAKDFVKKDVIENAPKPIGISLFDLETEGDFNLLNYR